MPGRKVRHVTSWVLAVVLAALYLVAAVGKLSGAADGMFAGWGYPAWFATVIGVAELAGAIGLLIPRFTRWAVIGLSAVMAGAAYTHLASGEGVELLRPLVFLAALWTVWWLRSASAAGGESAA